MKTTEKFNARLLQRAMSAHQAGQFDVARAEYETLLARAPLHPDALHFYGLLKYNTGDAEAGMAFIRQSLELAPRNANAWLNIGNILLERDDCVGAKGAYERSAELAPTLADAYHNLGICLRKTDDAPGAVKALDRAIALRADHAPSYYQRAIARRDSGDFSAAEADFRSAIALKRDYTEVYESLGMLMYRQGRIADAAQVYRAWAAEDPSSSTAAHLAAATSGDPGPERGSDAYISETFDRFAATFDQNLANLGYRAPQLVVDALVAARGASALLDCVLDAGCGTGLCGALLRPLARRLIGVDLSSGMVAEAKAKGYYDELHVAELGAYMHAVTARFDAIVCADTFVYFGALEEAFAAAAKSLKGCGLLIFTVEELPEGSDKSYRLEPHGRYRHRQDYIRSTLDAAGLEWQHTNSQVLRRERGEDVAGLVVVARLP